jgi:predicted MFS family arabinose efflux permease
LPIIAGFLLKKKSKLFILFTLTIVYAIILFVAGNINSALLIALLFVLFSSVDDIFLPLEDSLTNEFIKEDRAAMLSAKSMVTSLASIIGAPIAGLLLNLITYKQALLLSGLLIFVLPIIYLSVRQKIKMGQNSISAPTE